MTTVLDSPPRPPRPAPGAITVRVEETRPAPHRPLDLYAVLHRHAPHEVFLLENAPHPGQDPAATVVGHGLLAEIRLHADRITVHGTTPLVTAILQTADALGLAPRPGNERGLVRREQTWQLLRAVQDLFTVETTRPRDSYAFGFLATFGYGSAWHMETLPGRDTTPAPAPDATPAIGPAAGSEAGPDIVLGLFRETLWYGPEPGTVRRLTAHSDAFPDPAPHPTPPAGPVTPTGTPTAAATTAVTGPTAAGTSAAGPATAAGPAATVPTATVPGPTSAVPGSTAGTGPATASAVPCPAAPAVPAGLAGAGVVTAAVTAAAALAAAGGESTEGGVLPEAPRPYRVRDTCDEETFLARVRRCLEHIGVGDIYQIQIGHRIDVATSLAPLDVYRRLRGRNPSPYMYLLPRAGRTVIGASPEVLFHTRGGTVVMRPIAGTAPRSGEEAADRARVARLLADEKERAEHIMLVDLCRNDIGRVCAPGTLQTPDLMRVETYSHVFHLVSTVQGTLEAGHDTWSVLRAAFPAGTVTGAPKIRAMEIIQELESEPRGLYAGAVGLIDLRGWSRLALCIRTIVHDPDTGTYSTQSCAGIVADSRPRAEWHETLHKMGAAYWALTGRELTP
ncbi:anthranilate synthase component I family protein [Streptomyces sp. NPDC014685]|uniref:anthranilate synthase component I family protein n=1 Tax=Streptomyces sp. NPDC014685 TaxID=3364881 RepID=UPI0036F683E0